MKRFLLTVAALFAVTALFAQTNEEILARMDAELATLDSNGFSMVMELKIPILGSYSTTMYTFGDKIKALVDVKGEKTILWSDSVTDWEYDVNKNELTITNAKSTKSSSDDSMSALKGVTDGYDVKLKKEDDRAWYFICTKSKTNTNKDDPKKMDLVVAKGTYLPISHTVTIDGVKVVLHDFAKGVTEEEVTFDPSRYPTAEIKDERKN
jgi:outer membrane lipoprotein-sorting protein